MKQLEARFPRFLGYATGDDHDSRSNQIGIIACGHVERMSKWNRMKNIVGFGFGTGAVEVDEDDFAADAAHDECVGGRRTDHSTTNDSYFHRLIISMRWLLSGSWVVSCWVKMAKSPGRLWRWTQFLAKPFQVAGGFCSCTGTT